MANFNFGSSIIAPILKGFSNIFDKDDEEEEEKKRKEEAKKKANSKKINPPSENIAPVKKTYSIADSSPLAPITKNATPKTTTPKSTTQKKKTEEVAPVATFSPISPMFEMDYRPETVPVMTETIKEDIKPTFFKEGSGSVVDKILGTAVDAAENVASGFMSFGESAVDSLLTLGSNLGKANLAQANFNMTYSPYAATKKGREMASGIVATNNALQKKSDETVSEIIKSDLYDEQQLAQKYITKPFEEKTGINAQKSSVIGEMGAKALQSAGQLATQVGLSALGVPSDLTIGLSSFGGEMENALKQGATLEEATVSGMITAAGEILFERLSGGIKLGGKTLDEKILDPFIDKISNDVVRNIVNIGADAFGEGLEEIFSGVISNLGSALYKEENIGTLIGSEEARKEYVESFLIGSVLGGGSSTVKNAVKTVSEAIEEKKKNELTKTEKQVVEKETENRIAEEEKDGTKLTAKEKKKIREKVEADLEKGYISTDTIESVLGGKDYAYYEKIKSDKAKLSETIDELQKEYDTLNKMKRGDMTGEEQDRQADIKEQLTKYKADLKALNEDTRADELKTKISTDVRNLVKNSRLEESYKEISDRRQEALQVDFNKYKGSKNEEAVKKTLENAVNAKANNSNRVRDTVDMQAKLSSETGIVFDYKTKEQIKNDFLERQSKEIERIESIPTEERTAEQNELLSDMKKAYEDVRSGKRVINGYADGNNVVLNINEVNSVRRVSGHEISHILKPDTKTYDGLKDVLFGYAKSKGVNIEEEIRTRNAMYQGVKGADAEAELVSDLLGDYIFTDYDFVKALSTENRNVFQKVYDEVKYLYKLATAGSKEARELEKVKRNFEKALTESVNIKNTTNEGGVRYSIINTSKMTLKEQLNLLYKNELKTSDSLYLGITPSTVSASGLEELPLAFPTNNYNKSRKIKHNVPRRSIKKLNENLENALFSFGNGQKVGFILPDVDADGKQLLVGIEKGLMDRKPTNIIKSIYGIDNPAEWIQNQINEGKSFVLYNEKEANSFLQTYGYSASVEEGIKLLKDSITSDTKNVKKKQLEIIEKANPAPNTYSTWVRSVEDIKTLSETLEDSDWAEGDYFNPDLTRDMIEEAIESGKITVYSSYPIEQGVFVSPSYMEAESYSGDGKVYEKTVNIEDVAWIDPTQGMYANTESKRDHSISTTKSKPFVPFTADDVSGKDFVVQKPLAPIKKVTEQKADTPDIAPIKNTGKQKFTTLDIVDDDTEVKAEVGGKETEGNKLSYKQYKADRFERFKKRTRKSYEIDKSLLNDEFKQKRTELIEELKDKNIFISNNATELYAELSKLKKGVKASYELGKLLDLGYSWSELKSTLLKVRKWPVEVINPNSDVEQTVREALNKSYEDKLFELEDIDNEYERQLEKLGADAQEKIDKFKVANRRMTKDKELQSEVKKLIGDTSTWKDKKLGIQYAVNTLRRNLRDIVRDSDGKKDIVKADTIYDFFGGEYNKNHAQLNREANEIFDRFRKYKITSAEDKYIQMLGELRHNPDSELTPDTVNEFYEKHKKKIDVEKVDKIIEEARKLYDELLVRTNEVLSEYGMREIPYRKGYFPHFNEAKQNKLAKLLNWKTQQNEIPTSIAGITEQFKPVRSWQSFDKTRTSDDTVYSFTRGLDSYVNGSLDWIYHIGDIQKRRAFENLIRYEHSEKGIKEKIDVIRNNEEYDADEMQEQINLVFREAKNPLNGFLQDFTTATNTLANKKSSFDREVERYTNRKIYSTMTNLSNRVSGNMVAGSISSALTNFIPITQSWIEVSPVSSLKAMSETIYSVFKDDGVVEKSVFLTNRLRPAENLYKTKWDKIGEKASWLMDAVDNFTSQTVWRSKYNENLAKGMSENEAIKNADQFAENVIGGRSKGNMPTLFDAKNPIIKAVTAFQLEVNNQYGYMLKDVPTDMANEAKIKLIKGYATAFIGAYAYNALYSTFVGRDAALDPIGIIEELLQDLGVIGDENIFEEFAEVMGFFDEDDEEEEEIAPVNAFVNFTDNIIDELPFLGSLSGGGRIPLSSAFPYDGAVEAIKSSATDLSEKNYLTFTKEWLKPVFYLLLPFGGGQLKKTIEGVEMYLNKNHPVSGSYTDSGNLRFPVEETPWNVAQAALFGQYASKNAREYFDEGFAPLKDKQIEEFKETGMPYSDYQKYRKGLSGLKTLNEKGDYIGGLDLPVSTKNILINNIADREELIDMTDYGKYKDFQEFDLASRYDEKYRVLKEQGVSVKDYKENHEKTVMIFTDDYSWAADNPEQYAISKAVTDDVVEYRNITSGLYEIRADKDKYGKSINGSAKRKKKEYIWALDIEDGAKYVLFKNEYNADDTYNNEIINYIIGKENLTYDEKKSILEQLTFTVDEEGYVTW